MNKLLIHPKTKLRIDQIEQAPPQSLLLVGRDGSGKDSIAQLLVAKVLSKEQDDLGKYPFILTVSTEETSIPIDEIRSLQQFLKLKVPVSDGSVINRVVIIKQAEKMRGEAQNALLKTLEEPPVGTMILLTTTNPDTLLSTITSRVQVIEILPVSFNQAQDFYNKEFSKEQMHKSYALSQGLPALLNSTLNNSSNSLVEQIELAKQILAEKTPDRLLRSEELAKSKPEIRLLLDALLRITHAALIATSKRNQKRDLEQWQKRQNAVVQSIDMFNKNAQPKLVLDNLFLSI